MLSKVGNELKSLRVNMIDDKDIEIESVLTEWISKENKLTSLTIVAFLTTDL